MTSKLSLIMLFILCTNICYGAPNAAFMNSLFYPINSEAYDESHGYEGGIATLKEFVNFGLKKGSWINGDSVNNWVYRIKDVVNLKSTGTSISFRKFNCTQSKGCIYIDRVVVDGYELNGMSKGNLLGNAFASVPSILKVQKKRNAEYEAKKIIDEKLQAEKAAIEQTKLAEEKKKEDQDAVIAAAKELKEEEDKRKVEAEIAAKRKQMIYSKISGKYERFTSSNKSDKTGEVNINLLSNNAVELTMHIKDWNENYCSPGKVIGNFDYDNMQITSANDECTLSFQIKELKGGIMSGELGHNGSCSKKYCKALTHFEGIYTKY